MVDFKRKLARLPQPVERLEASRASGTGLSGVSDAAGRLADLRRRLADLDATQRRRAREPRSRRGEARDLPGASVSTPHGDVQRVMHRWALEHRHGTVELGSAARVDASVVARVACDETLAGLELERALFIDTETTGLAGGAGTLPFLIGFAVFREGHLEVHQLLLTEPGREGPMLALLADEVARASCLVTYNGKSFDWPLLRTRFVLNKKPVPHVAAHLDLLHAARRLWKRRLGEVSLGHVERQLLSFERIDDLPGAEIPGRYLEYLRSGDGGRLAAIVEHNKHDLVSLVALLGLMATRYASGDQALDPRDELSLAKVAVRAQDFEQARRWATSAASRGERHGISVEALELVAADRRRARDFMAARDALEQALTVAPQGAAAVRARLHLALAKLCEHQLGELRAALAHARCTALAEGEELSRRRTLRLAEKLEGAARVEAVVRRTLSDR